MNATNQEPAEQITPVTQGRRLGIGWFGRLFSIIAAVALGSMFLMRPG